MNNRGQSGLHLLAKLLLSGLLMVWALPVFSAPPPSALATQLQQFYLQQYSGSDMQVNAVINTPVERQPNCAAPNFSLMPNARPWGNVSVGVTCNGQKSFIQVNVQVSGSYWVAARNISSGGHIAAADIERHKGRLDQLPPHTITDEAQALNAISLRTINIGQPLTQSMLRRPWMVQAGQEVQVSANGGGYNITSTGKAMNNAAANDTVKVRMPSGLIVNGTVAADGTVSLMI